MHRFSMTASLLILWGVAVGAPPRTSDAERSEAEAALKRASVDSDSPALLKFFQARTPSEEDLKDLSGVIDELASKSFKVRERAEQRLIRCGRIAKPVLLAAQKSDDPDVAHRAERCLRVIEQCSTPEVIAAAARLLSIHCPEGAAEVLIDYLPVAQEEETKGAIMTVLARVGIAEGKPQPVLLRALADRNPGRRAAAGYLLGKFVPVQRDALRKLLADPEPEVRLETARGLSSAGDKEAILTLIALLSEGPMPIAFQAEDLLCRLLGDAPVPAVLVKEDQATRRICGAAWTAWWKEKRAAVSLEALARVGRPSGLTVIVDAGTGVRQGRVWVCGQDGKPRWEFEANRPRYAQLLPGGRVLVAEFRGKRVTERDFQGRILWQHATSEGPVSCQRLPNGNTFIATNYELCEVTSTGEVVFSRKPQPAIIFDARKLSNDHLLCAIHQNVVELDGQGREVKRIPVPGMIGGGSVEPLLNGNYLVAQWNKHLVSEIDATGKVVWECQVVSPRGVMRLPNGNVLVASDRGPTKILELNRKGQTVWSIATTVPAYRLHRP